MSNHKYSNIMNVAILASAILNVIKKAFRNRDILQKISYLNMDNHAMKNKNLIIGSLVGGIIGMTTALLLAPKAGGELINDIVHPFKNKKTKPPQTKDLKPEAKSRQKKAVQKKTLAVEKELPLPRKKETTTRRASAALSTMRKPHANH